MSDGLDAYVDELLSISFPRDIEDLVSPVIEAVMAEQKAARAVVSSADLAAFNARADAAVAAGIKRGALVRALLEDLEVPPPAAP